MKCSKTALLILIVVLSLLLAMCAPAPPSASTAESIRLKVSLVVSGSLGDKAFFDTANEGLIQASQAFNLDTQVYECGNEKIRYREKLEEASKHSDVVIVVGFEFYDLLSTMAESYPDVNFVYIDSIIEGVDNITSIDYAENEGAFLAGALAAMMTVETSVPGINPEPVIGMVGGVDIPVIRNFEAGFKEGARYVNPDIQVLTAFAGTFVEPEKGKLWAEKLYNQKADIVFHAAGAAGLGVFDAAKTAGAYAIGVDTDQRFIDPEVIAASLIKGVSLSIYETVERIQNGTFRPGTVYRYGIKEKGVDLAYGSADMQQLVPVKLRQRLEELKQSVEKGEIKVPDVK